jgi:VIT1/CCC1 family predicted Fe2+/Mn2+ transporter
MAGLQAGLLTTLAFGAGLTAAPLEGALTARVLGLLIAAATLAVGVGGYQASKARRQFFEGEIERERREIREDPEKEENEVRLVTRERGFEEEEVEVIVRRVTSDPELWLKWMVREELGLLEEKLDEPLRTGLLWGGVFLLGSLLVGFPFWFPPSAFRLSLLLGGIGLLGVGFLRSMVSGNGKVAGALETLGMGLAATALCYLLGWALS